MRLRGALPGLMRASRGLHASDAPRPEAFQRQIVIVMIGAICCGPYSESEGKLRRCDFKVIRHAKAGQIFSQPFGYYYVDLPKVRRLAAKRIA